MSEVGTGRDPTAAAERANAPEPAAPGAADATTPPGAATPTATSRAPLDDAQIAGVLAKANELEVTAGKLAETRAQDPAVKKLAAHMVREHARTDAQAQKLLAGHGITAATSDDSRRLDEDGQQKLGQLSRLTGPAFDQAYVDSQVAMHEDVLEKLDRELLPSAQNPALKTFLTKLRPALATHLEDARALQRSLEP